MEIGGVDGPRKGAESAIRVIGGTAVVSTSVCMECRRTGEAGMEGTMAVVVTFLARGTPERRGSGGMAAGIWGEIALSGVSGGGEAEGCGEAMRPSSDVSRSSGTGEGASRPTVSWGEAIRWPMDVTRPVGNGEGASRVAGIRGEVIRWSGDVSRSGGTGEGALRCAVSWGFREGNFGGADADGASLSESESAMAVSFDLPADEESFGGWTVGRKLYF